MKIVINIFRRIFLYVFLLLMSYYVFLIMILTPIEYILTGKCRFLSNVLNKFEELYMKVNPDK